ncbi:hypothetical protein [Kordiimonas marina]|uniref:hypothetical protein n=1 Tax=Kordiimonas marina TaxID=2872312 RepID=UPI001FF5D5BA|nr:hypothetical protein [Kordiimonas marina]MCJ9429317.1 hypothetical protein [Kordiimonas marina]
MRVKRLTVRLPVRLKGTAHHDARRIGEAVAEALWKNGGQGGTITVPGHGQSGPALAVRVGAALPKARGGKGHGH